MEKRKASTKTAPTEAKVAPTRRLIPSAKRRSFVSAGHKPAPLVTKALEAVTPLLKALHESSATGRNAARD